MKLMKKLLALILSIVMAITMFGGCSKEDSDEDDKSEKKKTVSIKGNKEDNEDKEDNDKNTPKKEIVVGYTVYAPMNYFDADGNLVGFDTELAKAVFQGLGYKVRFKMIDWSKKYDEVNSGAIDCIWNGFTCNASDNDGIARAEKVDFSYNYIENRQVVVVKKDSGIKTAADLAGKIGAAESGSVGEIYGKTFEGATIKAFTAQTHCLLEVMANTVHFAVVDAQLAKSYCGKGDYAELEILEELSSEPEYYAVAFQKGSALTAKVNKQLEKLAADGTIAMLAEKYGVATTAITDFTDQKK